MSKKTATENPKTRHVMVPLPQDLRAKIEKIAEKEDRSMAAICRRFISEGVATFDMPTPRKTAAR